MQSEKKIWKKAASLGLAVCMAATSIFLYRPAVSAEAAQEVTLESVRAEAKASESTEKLGFDIDLSDVSFTGGDGQDFSNDTDERHYMEILNNLKSTEDDQTIIIRFKTTQDGLLFGAGPGTTRNGKNMVFAIKGGSLRIRFRNIAKASGQPDFGLRGGFSSGLADGEYHTAAISMLPSSGYTGENVHVVIDGGSDIYVKDWGTRFLSGFNQGTEAFTTFQIGSGMHADADACNEKSFNGSIDFLTVINKSFTVEELQTITSRDKAFKNFSEMWAGGSCRTWMFTGGTEGVADFANLKTTRNWVGLFEDNLRAGGSFVERGRFVFNTSKRDADAAKLLEEYDVRIKPYGTRAVGIMFGAADYQKGGEGIDAFQATLQQLLEKLISDDKLPLLITPYPSKNEEEMKNIALYTDAIKETAGGKYKIVDLSEESLGLSDCIDEDRNLSPAGHQKVANAVKASLGLGGQANFSFDQLSDGSYTVAKKTDAGEMAEVQSVTGGNNSITVEVEEDTLCVKPAKLEYELTDESGAVISGSAAEGETKFEIDGLEKGASYSLTVFDAGRENVRESYRPVSIRALQGESGVPGEYADGNKSVNEKIKGLFTGDDPVEWLFMGDSITHGIVTQGYDSVPQLFAKYLDEIGRTDDIVLNTGVSNATIATTLDQIEPRLQRYHPDVVMIMLGTNDSSVNGENTVTNGSASTGGITAEQYKERYKELVRKIYETNPDAGIVLRVPCEMIPDSNHNGYTDKFDSIYEVAEEMEEELSGLNIVVVNHRQEWLDYNQNVRNDNLSRNWTNGNYGWLVDLVHPNGRGNVSMFQQIVKELGLYINTSELANYRYAVDAWTDSSTIAAPVTQRVDRAVFDIGSLSGYADKLKEVTLTLAAEDGRSYSKTVKCKETENGYAAEGTIALEGLDISKEYTVKVTGKNAQNSKEITFSSTMEKAAGTAAAEEDEIAGIQSVVDAAKEEIEKLPYAEEVLNKYKDEIEKVESTLSQGGLNLSVLEAALKSIQAAGAQAEKDQKFLDLQDYISSVRNDIAKLPYSKAVIEAYMASLNEIEKKYADRDSFEISNYDKAAAEIKIAEEKAREDEKTAGGEAKTVVSNALSAAGAYLGKENSYTPESWSVFEKAYKDALGADENANADTLNGLAKTLAQAIADLKEKEPVKEDPAAPEVGKAYDAGDYSYRITSLEKKTAEIAGIRKAGLKKVNVLSDVEILGVSYKVTGIAASAFKNNNTMTSVVIGKNVEEIGNSAFSGCKKLASVQINSTKLKKIGSKAFYNCKKLKKITIKSKVLKSAGKKAFKGTAQKLQIKVPKNKLRAYKKILGKKGQSKKARIF